MTESIGPVLEILSSGMGVTIQDLGRPGWKRFGIPPGGAMDRHSLRIANRLVGNIESAPALEWMLHGGRIRVIRNIRIAIAGGGASTKLPGNWRSQKLNPGDEIELKPAKSGLWTYLAVEGGIHEPLIFGSASAYPRAGMGRLLKSGDILTAGNAPNGMDTSDWHGGRLATWDDQRNFAHLPAITIWPGPQTDLFPPSAWNTLLKTSWTISSRSDRSGYRLSGTALPTPPIDMRSEPVGIGSMQVPPNGEPIITMRDGPTVGGYPKIAIVDDRSLDWLAQAAPGIIFRFQRA